jgi:hypothetical protein
MKPEILKHLLATQARDPGCEAGFELLDQYIDAVLRNEDAAARFPEVAAHLSQCDACREDTEGLLAALRSEKKNSPTT